ncbi:DUF1828 domain-containing protein [Limosilactobacillus reuteri]|uniref:DUF1828 domain-containing protein n=1 Tax=Limosilactobacillus reuteri TaxID=1598 RepID=UPI001E2AF13B|nr:DUF1828 domain-containing protein [Limosilactobacillus reuteri]MCC4371073.1 DUF1828 domain-containing protein [Limosilactobacillus reuteri]MCC4413344.1 DUF1828 domain-containing protein [Limosilactobacillus reuteri]
MNMFTEDKELNLITTKWNNWISKQTDFRRINSRTIQVLTSFTDAFGDGILFNIISSDNNTYSVTDNGYTIWNLETNGINVSKKNSNRNRILTSIVKPYNFSISSNKAIEKKKLSIDELPQAITDFVQVLINVSDIAFMNRTNTASIFTDDAQNYFSNRKTEYNFFTNSITLGKTNQQYRFDFNFMPKLQEFKLTKMYNTLSKNTMEAIIGIYSDTIDYILENFGKNASMNILVNGTTAKEKDYISGLQSHNINVIDFQNKSEVKDAFALVS